MTSNIGDLASTLLAPDVAARTKALAELVRCGPEASPVLHPLLTNSDADVRALAAQALAEIGAASDAGVFADCLNDADGRVRARGAQGLVRIVDPRAASALVRTLHDLPDVLHFPATLATYMLTAMARAALPYVIPLLDAEDALTRARGWLVVQTIVMALPEGRDWPALWTALGSYDPEAEGIRRGEAAARWQAWLLQHLGSPSRAAHSDGTP